jgi:GWxTD domain-containing protein
VRYTGGGVESNPSHEVPLGETGHALRAALHPGKSGGKVELQWRIADPSGQTVAHGDSSLTVGTEPLLVDFPLPTDRLSPGAHDVEVRLAGNGGERRHLSLDARLTPAWFVMHRPEAIEVLSLVARDEELDALKKAPADSGWADALASFWGRHDPSPGTEENEFLREIEQRVETAATLFIEPFRSPGWRTDRGRAWIRYGRPDRRTTSPGDFDHPGREVWEYDAPRRVLVFVDRGSGEYWLAG